MSLNRSLLTEADLFLLSESELQFNGDVFRALATPELRANMMPGIVHISYFGPVVAPYKYFQTGIDGIYLYATSKDAKMRERLAGGGR